MKKRITFVAQFPPPIHGLSKAVETLYGSRLKEEFLLKAINTMSNRAIISTLWGIIMARTDAFYFTISQTRGGLWRDIVLMMLMEMRQKPVIIHLHGGYLRTLIDRDCGAIERWLARKMIGKADCCIVLGNSLKWIFRGIVDEEKIAVVPNCVDDEYMLTTERMEAKTIDMKKTNVIHVLYLSNFIQTKGYREVLETAKIIKERGKGDLFCFHFAGKFFDSSEKEFFNSYIKENDLQSIAEYHGIVSGDAKRDLLQQCNVFMFPTRYPNEGQPISILEAMGNGMAIVTTNHAGIPDIATNENGLVLRKENISIEQIADYLEHCFSDRAYLKETCRRNYEQVAKLYTQKQYIDNMELVYNAVTK